MDRQEPVPGAGPRRGLASENLGGHSMASLLRVRAKQAELEPVLSGMAGRGRPLRILFVHSRIADVNHCMHELKRAHIHITADVVATSEQFVKRLNAKFYDFVVAEYPILHWKGMPALALLHQLKKQIPLIFVSDNMPLETVAELIAEGAADCVEMDHVGHLPVAVRRALSENNLREERAETEKMLRHSEARYRALVGNLTYGMCRCSTEGKYLDVNQALVTMLGYSSQKELLAVDRTSEVLRDPSKREQLLGHSLERDVPTPLEIDWKRKDGTSLKVRLSGREVNSEQGVSEGYEIIVEDVTQQRKLEDHLRQQAAKDPLTGLANYRHLVDVLDSEIKRSERTGREFALLLFDLDGLKRINDRYGHMTGSQALCRLADVMCIGCREMDTAARFGGDEFALILPETGGEAANLVAQRIRESFANDGKKPKLSVSVGLALYPRDGEKLDILLGAADVALYAMKGRTHKVSAGSDMGTGVFRSKAAAGAKTASRTHST
jgi:diguanylate cyclase (GGDEF)-like protein/PAS domain S-box-containing protein